jgi:HK97 family phage prohead protease
MQPDVYRFLEIKEVGEGGKFTGIASVYDVEDLGGDIIEKGAFKKTIAENPDVVILWQHDADEVIGKGRVSESGNKVTVEAQLDMDDTTAQKAYSKLKKGLIKGLSIGFNTIKSKWEEIEEDGKRRYIRRISELKLWEVSVVTFPMLPAAQVTRVKSVSDEEVATLKDQVEALSAEIATLKSLGAGTGSGAASPNPEPAASHSELFARGFDSMRALIPQ